MSIVNGKDNHLLHLSTQYSIKIENYLKSGLARYVLGFSLSRDFSNFQVPGTFRVSKSCPARTTGPSRSLGPVLPGPRDLGPIVLGVPGVLAGPSIFFLHVLHFFYIFLVVA